MKLYIPTCTLNFNNIFTTESISPKSFYLKRSFGNKRYYGVEANDLDDVILLYSKYPVFQVNDNGLENYPIVIEIETDDYTEGKFISTKNKAGLEVYTCSDTIYLNPYHCRVYFNSYAERQGALTKAEQSLENKFSKLYLNCFIIKQEKPKSKFGKIGDIFSSHENEKEFKWDISYTPSEVPSALANKIEEDARVDRIKGFLYCYLIGANASVSQEIAELQTIARNLRNTLSAAFNSPGHRPTDVQDASLRKNIDNFNQIFRKTDEAAISEFKKVENVISSNPLGLSVDQGVKFLKFANVYSEFCAKLGLTPTFDANELWTCFEDKSAEIFNCVVERLRIAVNRVVANERFNKQKQNINELVEIGYGKTVLIKDIRNKSFYEKLVQSQINGEYKKIVEENGVEASLAIAYNGGIILKKIMGDNWDNSQASLYITNLLNHFQESTPFDLFAINKEELVSFAAFCQKGDNIDRLLDYLEQCGIGNTKFALGLYGATYGFASLPKTFTSQLIDGDKEYYKGVYLDIYKNLFGKDLENAEFPKIEDRNNTSTFEDKLSPLIDKIEPNERKRGKVTGAIKEAARLEDAVQSPKAFMYIADNILSTRCAAYIALKKAGFENDDNEYSPEEFRNRILDIVTPVLPQSNKARKDTLDKINKSIQLEAKRQDHMAFLFILDNLLDRNDPSYKKICELIEPSVANSTAPPKMSSQQRESTPLTVRVGDILQCEDWIIKESSRLINDEKSKKKYVDDIDWFIDNHNPITKQGKRGCYYGQSTDNESVYDRLQRYLKRKQNPESENAKWTADFYKNIPLGNILMCIQKKFNVRQDYNKERQR